MSITTDLNAINGKVKRLLNKCNTSLTAKGSPTVPSLSGLPQAITDIKSGIEPLDHTVTFMVDGNPYEIVSVKNGNSVNAPLNEPTSASGSFNGWGQALPFVPSGDVELNAKFSNRNIKMEFAGADTSILTDEQGVGVVKVSKKNEGTCVCGVSEYHPNGYYMVYLVAIEPQTLEAAEAKQKQWNKGTTTYNGKLYNWTITKVDGGVKVVEGKEVVNNLQAAGSLSESDLKKILDTYYKVI